MRDNVEKEIFIFNGDLMRSKEKIAETWGEREREKRKSGSS